MLPLLCDLAELADRQAVRCKKEALENVLLCSSKGDVTMRGHKTKPIAQAEELDESALAKKQSLTGSRTRAFRVRGEYHSR